MWSIWTYFLLDDGEFEKSNFKKVKFRASARGVLKFQIDQYKNS